jgi:hypothetical protein
VERVSSVTAFIARYGERPSDDPMAAAIIAELDADARAVVDVQRLPVEARPTQLAARTGRSWTAASIAHAERRAFTALRRALQRRGLLTS